MRDDVELFTLESAQREQSEWSAELRAFAGMVSAVRDRHFGKTINDQQMLEIFETLVDQIEVGSDETD